MNHTYRNWSRISVCLGSRKLNNCPDWLKSPLVRVVSRVAATVSSERKRLMLRNIRLDNLCVRLCVAAERIRVPFWVVSGVGRGMGVFDGSGNRRRVRAVLG